MQVTETDQLAFNTSYVKMACMDHDGLIEYLEVIKEIVELNDGDIFASLNAGLDGMVVLMDERKEKFEDEYRAEYPDDCDDDDDDIDEWMCKNPKYVLINDIIEALDCIV